MSTPKEHIRLVEKGVLHVPAWDVEIPFETFLITTDETTIKSFMPKDQLKTTISILAGADWYELEVEALKEGLSLEGAIIPWAWIDSARRTVLPCVGESHSSCGATPTLFPR